MSPRSPESTGLAAAAAGIVFSLGMVLIQAFKIPVLRYHPVTRTWDLSATGGSVPMLFYGQLLWAGLAAGATFLALRALVRAAPSTRTWLLVTGWLLLASLLALSYYAHANWP